MTAEVLLAKAAEAKNDGFEWMAIFENEQAYKCYERYFRPEDNTFKNACSVVWCKEVRSMGSIFNQIPECLFFGIDNLKDNAFLKEVVKACNDASYTEPVFCAYKS